MSGPLTIKAAKFPVDGERDFAIMQDGFCIAEVFGRVGQNERRPAEETAKAFVLAYNAHDALVEALTTARKYVDRSIAVHGEGFAPHLAEIDAAFKLAGAAS